MTPRMKAIDVTVYSGCFADLLCTNRVTCCVILEIRCNILHIQLLYIYRRIT